MENLHISRALRPRGLFSRNFKRPAKLQSNTMPIGALNRLVSERIAALDIAWNRAFRDLLVNGATSKRRD